MARQNFDTPTFDQLQRSSRAVEQRAAKVAWLRTQVALGLYRVDSASLARALVEKRAPLGRWTADGHSLDRVVSASHAC